MKKLRVAAISTRNWIGQTNHSIQNMNAWAEKAVNKGAEFIVFPELGVNGYFHSTHTWDIAEPVPGPSTEKLIISAKKLNVILCFGILERDMDVVYNTQVVVNKDGILGKQRKIHMPGQEYLYWRSGFEIETINIGKAIIGISICYDSNFSEMARTLFCKGAEILVMPFAYDTGPREKFPEKEIGGLVYRVHCRENCVLTNAYEICITIHMRTTLILDDELITRAREFTGIEEKTRLVHLGLKALIEREAARRLALMKGTMPVLKVAARKRLKS